MKKYESVFFIPWPPVNFHINRGDFLLKIRGGPWWSMVVHGPGPWGGPWTPVHVLYASTSKHSTEFTYSDFPCQTCVDFSLMEE